MSSAEIHLTMFAAPMAFLFLWQLSLYPTEVKKSLLFRDGLNYGLPLTAFMFIGTWLEVLCLLWLPYALLMAI